MRLLALLAGSAAGFMLVADWLRLQMLVHELERRNAWQKRQLEN
jgi:hypothetical protein